MRVCYERIAVDTVPRLLSAIVGLLTGGLVGMLALYFVMLLVGSDFGLDNVRAERCVRAGLGRMEQQPNGKLKFVGPIPPRFQAMCSPKPRQGRCFPIGRNADDGPQDPVYISYRRYRIVDETDLREAAEKLQAHLEEQHRAPVIIPVIVATRQLAR
jgi:hypothetical protein